MTKGSIEIHKVVRTIKVTPKKKAPQAYYWARFKAKNGEKIGITETETRKHNVKKSIRAIAYTFGHMGTIRIMDCTFKKTKEIYI